MSEIPGSTSAHPGDTDAIEAQRSVNGRPLRLSRPSDDDFDALADLFLGEAEPGVPAPARPSRPALRAVAPIEAVVLGHLPVWSGAWLKAYAHHVARTSGVPVGLIRLQGGLASVEIVAGRRETSGAQTLQDAIHAAAQIVGRWLIRVDEPSEPDLPATPGVGAVTLLSGADEAAIVGTYRAIKGLEQALAHETLTLGVAFMGCDEARAAEAFARVERATGAFLGTPVTLAGCCARVDAPPTTTLYRGPAPQDARAIVESLRNAGAEHPSPPPPEPRTPAPGASDATVASTVSDEPPRATAPQAPPDSAIIDGLTSLGRLCPEASGVELATAHDGSLHLIHGPDAPSAHAGVEELLAASAWARRHDALLRRAFPRLSTERITLHLVTRDAASVRRLAGLGISLHLLVEARGARVCVPL